MNKILKLLLFNLGLASAYIILFAPSFLGWSFSLSSPFMTSVSAAVVVFGAVFGVYGNYRMLTGRPILYDLKPTEKIEMNRNHLQTLSDCREVLENLHLTGICLTIFGEVLERLKKQISRYEKKQSGLEGLLEQRFETGEMTYGVFQKAICDVEKVITQNIRTALIRINSFDTEEYAEFMKQSIDRRIQMDFHNWNADKVIEYKNALVKNMSGSTSRQDILLRKAQIFAEYFEYVARILHYNDHALLKLDELLAEISKLDNISREEIETMQSLEDIADLISKTSLYK